ncbi:hypothetical protein BVI1335_750063 [Burkholderia vietnamiensis]|nr:hypothetical protein BVI1335_750063 [Burkholderia vietnamiensis]
MGELARADENELVRRDLVSESAELQKRIDEHLRTAAAIMRANLDRWSR